jgi:5'-phosphate synthase pdxT subunit
MLEPLREFVKGKRKPVWGTCAGLILLAEEATRTKRDGQELIGGLDVRVVRNHFGRQAESFIAPIDLPFLGLDTTPFDCVFIRAPIVDCILTKGSGTTAIPNDLVSAPKIDDTTIGPVEVLARYKNKAGEESIVAVRQGNRFGTSFHPELTPDTRVHEWWLSNFVLSTI